MWGLWLAKESLRHSDMHTVLASPASPPVVIFRCMLPCATPSSSCCSANEGAKLWIDDVLVAATPINGQSAAGSRASATLALRAGTSHFFVLDYYEAWNSKWLNATVSVNGAAPVDIGPSMVRGEGSVVRESVRPSFLRQLQRGFCVLCGCGKQFFRARCWTWHVHTADCRMMLFAGVLCAVCQQRAGGPVLLELHQVRLGQQSWHFAVTGSIVFRTGALQWALIVILGAHASSGVWTSTPCVFVFCPSYLDTGFPDLSIKPADWIRLEPGPIGFGFTSLAIPAMRDAAREWYVGELTVAKTKQTLAEKYNMVGPGSCSAPEAASFFLRLLLSPCYLASFHELQGIPKYKIGLGGGKDGRVGEGLVGGGDCQ